MHELAVAEELLDLCLRTAEEHSAASVVEVRLRVGVANCLSPDSLSFGFECLAASTKAAQCRLAIEREPAIVRCTGCDYHGEVQDLQSLECPVCGTFPLQIEGGRDLVVESITVE